VFPLNPALLEIKREHDVLAAIDEVVFVDVV
jgi:hypothetical protein